MSSKHQNPRAMMPVLLFRLLSTIVTVYTWHYITLLFGLTILLGLLVFHIIYNTWQCITIHKKYHTWQNIFHLNRIWYSIPDCVCSRNTSHYLRNFIMWIPAILPPISLSANLTQFHTMSGSIIQKVSNSL